MEIIARYKFWTNRSLSQETRIRWYFIQCYFLFNPVFFLSLVLNTLIFLNCIYILKVIDCIAFYKNIIYILTHSFFASLTINLAINSDNQCVVAKVVDMKIETLSRYRQ